HPVRRGPRTCGLRGWQPSAALRTLTKEQPQRGSSREGWMRPDDAVIDLGDERWSADDLPRPGRRYGRGYRLVVLVATLAALLPLAGSHRPTPLITAPLWVADEPGVVLGDRVYTFSNTGRLTARSLRDGAIEWQLSGLTPNAYVAELNAALLGHVMYETQTDT